MVVSVIIRALKSVTLNTRLGGKSKQEFTPYIKSPLIWNVQEVKLVLSYKERNLFVTNLMVQSVIGQTEMSTSRF